MFNYVLNVLFIICILISMFINMCKLITIVIPKDLRVVHAIQRWPNHAWCHHHETDHSEGMGRCPWSPLCARCFKAATDDDKDAQAAISRLQRRRAQIEWRCSSSLISHPLFSPFLCPCPLLFCPLSLSLFLLHFVPLPFNWRLEVPSPPRSISVPVWAAPWADSSRHLVGRMQGGLIVILNYNPPNRHDGRHESRSQPL